MIPLRPVLDLDSKRITRPLRLGDLDGDFYFDAKNIHTHAVYLFPSFVKKSHPGRVGTMSFNDGKQLLVFGLSFAQHDSRKMQQLLRHYDKLPDNPGSRANLFVQLNKVARELMADEAAQDQIQQLTDWMLKGGDFPLGVAPATAPANPSNEPRPAQGAYNGYQPGFAHHLPSLANRQGYFGASRTPSGQQNIANGLTWHGAATQPPAANLGRQYGRGRTVDGDWEEIDGEKDDEGEEEEKMDTSMQEDEDEDEDMLDPMEPFPLVPRQARRDGPQRGTAFSGPGRSLNAPSEQEPSATVAINEAGAGGSAETEEQAIARLSQLVPPTPEQLAAELNRRWQEQERLDDENVSAESEGVLDDESDENGPSPDDGQELECPICLEDYPPSRFPKPPTITEFCDHPDKACLNCLESSIAAIIERGALHLLACPICPQRLSRRDMREYASRPVYERYKYLREQSQIPGHYISCTNPKCGGSQPHDKGEDPMVTCNHCGFATCARHRRPWHEGQTCQEFDLDDEQIERLEEEEATAKLLSGEAMSICPKCGQGVTKSDGCDHMRCQCGQEWCYVVS